MTTMATTDTSGLDGPRTITIQGSAAGFAQEITVGPHRLAADEPMSVGGTDTGPNPYDLLLAALGSDSVDAIRGLKDATHVEQVDALVRAQYVAALTDYLPGKLVQ